MANKETLLRLLRLNTMLSPARAEERADHLLRKGLLDTNDVGELYGTSAVVITVWAREGRIPGAFKPNSEWLFLVDKLPDKLRISQRGRGGLPMRLMLAIASEGTKEPARVIAERYGVAIGTVYKIRRQQAKNRLSGASSDE